MEDAKIALPQFENPQGRRTGRLASRISDQARNGDQPQNREGARLRSAADTSASIAATGASPSVVGLSEGLVARWRLSSITASAGMEVPNNRVATDVPDRAGVVELNFLLVRPFWRARCSKLRARPFLFG